MQEHCLIFAKQSKIMKLKNLKETTLNDFIKQDINHQNIFPVKIFFPLKRSLRTTEQSTSYSTTVQQQNPVKDYISSPGNRINLPFYAMTAQQRWSRNAQNEKTCKEQKHRGFAPRSVSGVSARH